MVDGTSETFAVIGRGVAKPGRREELIELFEKVRDMDEAKEPGTIVQSFQFERDDPNVFWEYIVFANTEARETHYRHLVEIGHIEKVRDIFSVWPEAIICTPLCAKGIDFT